MKLNIYSIFDCKADAYITPFFLPKEAMALRAFQDAINSPTHQFNSHPGDYVLWQLGTFDVDTGVILEHRQHVADGLSLYRPSQQQQLDFQPVTDERTTQ